MRREFSIILTKGNMELLTTRTDILHKLVPKNAKIAELGVFMGEFSNQILAICQPSELHLIDTFTGSAGSGNKDGINIITVHDMNEMQCELVRRYKNNPEVKIIRGKAEEVLHMYVDGYFDMIYIDTIHDYLTTTKTLEVAWKKTKIGGLVCGHDYNLGWNQECVKAVDEFCKKMEVSISCLTNDFCMSFVIKR